MPQRKCGPAFMFSIPQFAFNRHKHEILLIYIFEQGKSIFFYLSECILENMGIEEEEKKAVKL